MTRLLASLILLASLVTFTGCAAPPATDAKIDSLTALADEAKDEMIAEDLSLASRFDDARGYVIFPGVTKGVGLGFGGARGEGVVYDSGRPVALTTLGQGNIGFGIGGMTYKLVIFFDTDEALELFLNGKFGLNAQAAAVAGNAGASVDADFYKNSAVISNENVGLVLEAMVGLQNFNVRPID
ncbi:YSC84-related protein [Mucisphaera sp.]|uniref:YSC84-related protein n=1 Tax=Mucisphaera sp. TaxID=2913024 RepID=UPI003D153380